MDEVNMNGSLSEEVLVSALTKGGKKAKNRKYSDMYDPNYVKMVEKTTYFFIYRQKIMELVLSLFKWENLPDSMNSKYLEKTLHYQGSAVVAKHKKTNEICNFRLSATRGKRDVYGEPLIFSINGYQYDDQVHKDNAVIIYNNKIKRGTLRVVNHMAFKLAEADLVISQNISAQSFPVVITGPESKKKDIASIMRARGNFVPYIMGNEGLDDIKIEVQNMSIPYVVDKIDTHKHVIWNEAMTFLGVENANQEKKERMVVDEIAANDEQTNMFRQSMLMERQEAVKKVNEMFGTDITVEFNNGVMDELSELMNMAKIEEVQSQIDLNNAEAELKIAQSVFDRDTSFGVQEKEEVK